MSDDDHFRRFAAVARLTEGAEDRRRLRRLRDVVFAAVARSDPQPQQSEDDSDDRRR